MHGLETLKKLNQQFARPAKPSRPSAVQRIKSLRDQFDRRADELLRRDHPRLHDAVTRDLAFGSAYTYFVCELNELLDRIERDEKEVS